MQINIYKVNDIEYKLKTRKLYEACFDAGKRDFIDYYYDVIIKRNEVVAILDDDGNVLSMVHLNPYIYNIMGQETRVHYLVAVATDEHFRGRGFMRLVLSTAIKYLRESGEMFCIIVPNDDRLMKTYENFGFEKAGMFNIDKFSNEKFDIFPVRNDEFNELMRKEEYFLGFETEEYIEDLKSKVVMVNILNEDSLPFKSKDKFMLKSIYVCQEV